MFSLAYILKAFSVIVKYLWMDVVMREWVKCFSRGTNRPFCGGTLLSRDTVLTAAHCQPARPSVDKFEVVVGEHDVTRADGEQRIAPSQWISHPAHNYIAHTPDIDLAIVKLAQNVSFSSRVKPACLPKVASSYASKVATVSGWGTLNEGGNQPNTLQKVNFLFVIMDKTILIISGDREYVE